METLEEARVLRIYISNTDKFRHTPLYEMVVFAARRYGLAGATVIKGEMGFGSSSTIHSHKFWEITEKLPVVVEIIDSKEKIDAFTAKILPWFQNLRYGCLITTHDANIKLFKKGTKT